MQRVACGQSFFCQRGRNFGQRVGSRCRSGGRDLCRRHQAEYFNQLSETRLRFRRFMPPQGFACPELPRERARSGITFIRIHFAEQRGTSGSCPFNHSGDEEEEGCKVQIWDDNVSLGQLIGSNRQYIEEVIPHIGSLLSSSLEHVLSQAEVVVIGTRGIDRKTLDSNLQPGHVVVDLVNLEKSRRPSASISYEGMCW